MGLKSRFYGLVEFARANAGRFILLGEFTLVAACFFGLGVIYARDFAYRPPELEISEPAVVESDPKPVPPESSAILPASKAVAQVVNLVASKNGETYYLTTCRNNIKEENKIYFKTREEAEKAGFRPAKNCFK